MSPLAEQPEREIQSGPQTSSPAKWILHFCSQSTIIFLVSGFLVRDESMLGMLMMWVLMVCIMVEVFAEPAVTFTFLSITDNYKLRGNITRIPAAKLAENAHLVCNTGDIISPYAEAYVDHGRAMLRLYQATNVSLSTVGKA